MEQHRGIFITFEGSEGCGKSTQVQRLARRFESTQRTVVVTREPGSTEIGESIRSLLKDPVRSKNMFPETELLLFGAARAQLVREVIAPALEERKVVLCDRFLDSTTIYQGIARKISPGMVEEVNALAIDGIMPHLTILLDVPAEIGFERIKKTRGGDAPDRMEMESLEFYKAVHAGFMQLAAAAPQRFFIVDGTADVDTVENTIWHEINRRFSKF